MTIIIVSIIFSAAWLMYGFYNEIRMCCGNSDVRYPYCIVVVYHMSMILLPILAVLLWAHKLTIDKTCEVDFEDSNLALCALDGPWVTFAVTIGHCVFLLSYLVY